MLNIFLRATRLRKEQFFVYIIQISNLDELNFNTVAGEIKTKIVHKQCLKHKQT